MARLKAKYIKIVAAGGDLDGATEKKLSQDAVQFTIEGNVIDHLTSDNVNPKDRYEDGTMYALKGKLCDVLEDDLVLIAGGAVATSVYTKTQGIRALPKYDIELGVLQHSGTILKKTLTNMQFVDTTDLSYEVAGVTYLPFSAKSTDTTQHEDDPTGA